MTTTCVLAAAFLVLAQVRPPELERGLAAFAAGDMEAAERDLAAAVGALERDQAPAAEIAAVEQHLAHAHFRLGRRDDARRALASAWRRAPTLELDPASFPRGLVRIYESVRSGGRLGENLPADPSARAARLIPELRHDNVLVREAAQDELVAIGVAARPMLELALRERVGRVREGVLWVLHELGLLAEPSVLNALRVSDESVELKLATASGLRAGDRVAVARVLFQLAADGDARVRTAAAEALLEVLPRVRAALSVEHTAPGCFVAGLFPVIPLSGSGMEGTYKRIVFKPGGTATWYWAEASATVAHLPRPTLEAAPVSYYIEVLAQDPGKQLPLAARDQARVAEANLLARTPETMVGVIRAGESCPGGLPVAATADDLKLSIVELR